MKEIYDLKGFVKTATQDEIIKYWKEYLAPKYGYKRLIDTKTGKIIASIQSVNQ